MYLADIFVCAMWLAGLPALSLPVGRSEGLPDRRAADRAARSRRRRCSRWPRRSSGVIPADAEVR